MTRSVRIESLAEVRRVELEPNWRAAPFDVTYVFLAEEPTSEHLLRIHRRLSKEPNVRVISPAVLGWSAVLNPLFFAAVRMAGGPSSDLAAEHEMMLRASDGDDVESADSADDPKVPDQLVVLWLQSVTFLAAVTLSAAIIQRRYSAGTMGSKYDRLWQAGAVSRNRPHLAPTRALDLEAQVGELAADANLDDVERLIQIRRLFEAAVTALAHGEETEAVTMAPADLDPSQHRRFDFVDELRRRTDDSIDALVVYGSSVTSPEFADYDLVLVTGHPERVLRALAGTSPTWKGKELNLGVYSPEELWHMQLLSGDNLSDYGRCLFGEVVLPKQDVHTLLRRNFSFGMVRLRQQLGMLDPVLRDPYPDPRDDRRSLYEYFVKVPANVARGTLAAAGEHLSKEATHAWMRRRCDFDTPRAQAEAGRGHPGRALADSAIASTRVLQALNDDFDVARRVRSHARALATS